MTWWGWLIVSILGLIIVGGVTMIAVFLIGLAKSMNWLWPVLLFRRVCGLRS